MMLLLPWRTAGAQTGNENRSYGRLNSFGVFAAYSGDSSHMILGVAEKRKLLNIGVSYSRRLWMYHGMVWQYDGELIPVALEGDPNSREIITEFAPTSQTAVLNGGPIIFCAPLTQEYSFEDAEGVVHSGAISQFCHGRQWTVGQAMLPVGFQWNFLPRHKIQPIFTAHIGYMYSTQPIPVALAGSFNFTFDFGGGVEVFRSRSRSVRVEYRYHHISNHDSAYQNPGIDNGLFQVGYVFGR